MRTAIALIVCGSALLSSAATFTVNNTNVSGPGSLQQAIIDANAAAGPDTIAFAIPGDGPHVISPSSAQPLPSLTNSITIDGYTQPGATPNTLTNGFNAAIRIQLDGASAGSFAHGLTIVGTNNVVRGLSITRFGTTSSEGISIGANADNNVIEGNLIGLHPTNSTADYGNARNGITITSAAGNLIGGATPGARNLIADNTQYGIQIQGARGTNNTVQGNAIGLAINGVRDGNGSGGIFLAGVPRNTIQRNVISGNTGSGILLQLGSATNNFIHGNVIGTDYAGTLSRSNTINGIWIIDASRNTIGGTNVGEGNLIALNGRHGVQVDGAAAGNQISGNTLASNINAGVFVTSGTNNSIRANSIVGNRGFGIDLDPTGVNSNDFGDGDSGPNLRQNHPALTNLTVTRTNLTIRGRLESAPTSAYTIEFFANINCDLAGWGGGEIFLGSAAVTTDGTGNANFSVTLPGSLPGLSLTATATDAFGNTSEFSPCLDASPFIPHMTYTVTNTNDSGPGSLRQALLDVNTEFGSDRIVFNIPGSGIQTIFPGSPLPTPLDPVFIDGYTQPGTVPNTLTNGNNASLLIRLDGRSAGGPGVDGFHFTTSSNTVRGVIVVRFSGDGIHFEGGQGNRVEDVWLGWEGAPAAPSGSAAGSGVAAGLLLAGNGEYGLQFSEVYAFYVLAAMLSGNDIGGLCVDEESEGGEVINCDATENGEAGFVIAGDNVTVSYSYGGYSPYGFRIMGDNNTFRFSASGVTVDRGWSVMGNNNSFQRSSAWQSMGDGWNIMGNGNILQDCDAYDIADDVVSVESGIGNRFSFLGFIGVSGDLIDDPVRQDDLSNLSAGYSSTTAARIKGTISAPFNGTYTVSVMVDDSSDPYPDGFVRVAAFNVSKSSATNPASFNQVINVTPPIKMGDKVLAYVTGPAGSSEAMTVFPVSDMMPDVRSTIMPFSPSVVRAGDTVQATVQVSNEQFGPASDVWGTVNSTFARIVDITPPEGGTVTGPVNGTYTVGLGALSIGGSVSYSVKMVPPNSGSFFLTVNTLLVGETDGNPANNVDGRSGSVSSGTNSQNNATVADTTSGGDTLHPISTFTGELFEPLAPDLDLGGPMRLAFSRYYASFLQRLGRSGSLGHNWRHGHEWSLVNNGATVDIVNDRGRLITFTNSGGAYVLLGRKDIAFQLHASGGNFILGEPRSQRIYTFNGTGQLTKVEDGRGNSHTLVYAADRLVSVSDGLGRALSFEYSAGGLLTNVSDGVRSVAFTQTGSNLTGARSPLGFTTTYAYDPTNAFSGLLTSATMPEGNVPYAQTFDAVGRVASQTVAPTNTHRLTYATNVVTVTDPLGRTRRDVHSPRGELLAFIDEAGLMMAMDYNANGQRTAVADRLANIMRLAYHTPSGYVSAITNTDGTVTSFSYTNRITQGVTFFDLAQVTHPDGTSERFTYDTNGNVLARIDRAGRTFSYTYNSRGQVLTAENPIGGTITYTYHPNGTLASRDDSDTGPTSFFYDSLNRLTNVVHADGATIKTAYDANNRVVRVTDERTNTYAFLYDDNGNVTQVTDPVLRTTEFAYDARDRLTRTLDRLGRAVSIAYDPLEHVAAVTNRNGDATQFAYDTRRRLATITDQGSQAWNFGYDNEALLTGFANPLGQTNRIRRDSLGYDAGFVNALNQTNLVTRDPMRRVTQSIDALLRTNSFGYDERGLLTNSVAPVVGSASFQRNNFGLLSRITDLNGSQWNFAYTPMGRISSVADPLNRTNRYTYDNRGRRSFSTFADGTTCSNAYDTAGHIIRRVYSDGTELQYAYDEHGHIVAANGVTLAYDAESRLTNTTMAGASFGAAYDGGGRLTNVTYNSGAFAITYTYDSRSRLIAVRDSLTGTQLDFTYDNAGRLTGLTRPNGVNGTYTYDAAGRLTRIQEGTIVDLDYTLDAAAQITNLNYTLPLDPTNGFANSSSNWTYDAAHQINNTGYSYDARGRLTNSPGHSLRYDGASRLTRIDSIELRYNGVNDLVTRIQGGTATRYLYNYAISMRPIVAEKNDTTGQILRYYVWSPAGALLYMVDAANGNAVRHFHFDRVGSTIALTDSAGAVTDSYAYTPYGELLGRAGTSEQPFLYIGRYGVRSEPAANLYHMRARYYDPASARFLTRDPVWPLLAQPLTLQPYQYAINNPLKYIDPRGRQSHMGDLWYLFLQGILGGGYGPEEIEVPEPEPYVEPLEDILADTGPLGAYTAMMAAMSSQGDDDYIPARLRPTVEPKVTANPPVTLGSKPRKAITESGPPMGSMPFPGKVKGVNSGTGVPMSARPGVVVTSRTGEPVVPAPGLEEFLRDIVDEMMMDSLPFPLPPWIKLPSPVPGGGMQKLDPSTFPEPVEDILDEVDEVFVPS